MQASQRGPRLPSVAHAKNPLRNTRGLGPSTETGVEPEEDDASDQAWSCWDRDRGLRLRNSARCAGGPAIRATHSTPKNPGPGNIAKGKVIFNGYFCAACHTLKAAGPDAYGQLGVNLNKVTGGVPYETAKAVTINGLPAALPLYPTQMVGYKNVLTDTEADRCRHVRLEVRGDDRDV